ncbi:MAG: hypothetical protein O7B99_01990 [Planctomycetota bacterium]|nr:hypothetical protein [Planctomycetota bacterium]
MRYATMRYAMMRSGALLLALSLLPAGCAGLGDDYEIPLERETSTEHLDLAEQEIERGELEAALERLIAVRGVDSLPPEARFRSERLIDRCAGLLIDSYSQPGVDSGELEALWEQELSSRMRARAGVRAAAQLLAEGSRILAVKQIRAVESELPLHQERQAAGEVLAEAGFSLIRDPGRYWLVRRYGSRGIEALEFLVVTYPLDPSCPQAYSALAQAYEDRGNLDLALEQLEYVLRYHIKSEYAVRSEARLPYLRMQRLERTDHDRNELLTAQSELRTWLRKHTGHELEEWVRATENACMVWLADSDVRLARYYVRTDNPFGARLHALRALDEATEAGDPGLVAQAQDLLDALSPEPAESHGAEAGP